MEKTASAFVQNVVSIHSGHNAEETGINIQKRASSIQAAQIAAKVDATLCLDGNVEACKQGLIETRLNSGQLITDNQEYIQKLLNTVRT